LERSKTLERKQQRANGSDNRRGHGNGKEKRVNHSYFSISALAVRGVEKAKQDWWGSPKGLWGWAGGTKKRFFLQTNEKGRGGTHNVRLAQGAPEKIVRQEESGFD